MTRISLRFSEGMLSRLNDACEREGIDRSSLVVAYMYQVTKQVDSPEFYLSYYSLDSGGRNKTIDFRVSKTLKLGFEKALKEFNEKGLEQEKLTTSNVLGSYLIKFIVESERRSEK